MANEAVIGALRAVLGMDTAEFDLAVDRSKKKLSDFDKLVETLSANNAKNLATLITAASGVFSAIQIGETIKEIGDFTDRVLKQTAAFKDLSERVNLTTDAYQAVRLAGISVGTSSAQTDASLLKLNQTIGAAIEGNKRSVDLFKQLGVNLLDTSGKSRSFQDNLQLVALALDRTTDSQLKARLELQLFGASGRAVDSMVHQLAGGVGELQAKFAGGIIPQKVIDDLDALEKKAGTNQAKFEAFWASIAGPIYLTGVNALADGMERVARAVTTPIGTDWKQLLFILANPTLLPQFFLPKLASGDTDENAKQIAAVMKEIAGYQAILADPRYGDARKRQIQEEIDKLNAQLAILQSIGRQQATNARIADMQSDEDKARRGSRDVDPHTGEGSSPPARTGGSHKTPTDRIGDMIDKLKEQTTAAKHALAEMVKGAEQGLPLKQVEDAVDLQKKIDDAIAALHRGGISANDPRLEQLKQQIKLENEAEAALRKRKETEAEADRVERQFGDGTAAYTDTVNKLWDALNTGRLKADAFVVAMKDANDKLDEADRKARGAKGGLDGFIAGMEEAAEKDKKANSAFSSGQQFWNIAKDGITDIVDSFVTMDSSIDQTLKNVGMNIAKFAFNLLVLQPIFDAIKSMIKDATTPSAGGSGGGGGIWTSIFSWIGSAIGGFAEGGRPPTGTPYLVGEKGPEIRVDDVPGSVYSHQDSVNMLRNLATGAGRPSTPSLVTDQEYGSGDRLTLVQHINVLPDINTAIKRQIVDNMPLFAEAGAQRVQAQRRQGGKIKATFLGR